jgi:PAS domain-containing protein
MSAGPLDTPFFILLTESYRRLLGHELVPPGCGPRWLYDDAPFAVLAHNTEADPRFVYANTTAQKCFEYSWEEFIQLPSRFSAEPDNREQRQRLLETVAAQNFVTGYRGIRISKSGRRFWIDAGVVWQLIDPLGIYHGQAALFRSWHDA